MILAAGIRGYVAVINSIQRVAATTGLLFAVLLPVASLLGIGGDAWAQQDIKDPAITQQANPGTVQDPAAPPTFPSFSGTDFSTDDWSSNAFGATMWVAGIGVGIVAFLLFLLLNKKVRSSRDWVWPLLPVLFLGYVTVFGPIWITDDIYERWSDKCLSSDAAPSKRVPDDPNGSDAACKRAQLDHGALGYSALVGAYRNNILNGSEQMLTPRELKGLAWVLLVGWAGAIYFTLLTLRNRFFVR